VDRARDLIRIAEQRGGALQVRYLTEDAESLGSLANSSFDGATCCLVLTDFADLSAVLAATARVLKPNGWLVVATMHPCFEAPHAATGEHNGRTVKLVGQHFEEGRWWPRDQTRFFGQIGWHHRTLSSILSTFLDSGYQVDRAREPQAPAEIVAESPWYGEVAEVLTLRWRWRGH
jgi:ubiquinone/menaquinone biosynthesis C-methylase UbiE